jgi:hypothetical protein
MLIRLYKRLKAKLKMRNAKKYAINETKTIEVEENKEDVIMET